MRKLFFSFLGLWFLIQPAFADETSEPLPGVSVEHARVYAADQGENTFLEFRIDNASGIPVRLTEISSSLSDNIEVILEDGSTYSARELSLFIDDQETLTFGKNSHIVALKNIKRTTASGETVRFSLAFNSVGLDAWAHTHQREKAGG